MDRIDRFISYSERVGNVNTIIPAAEIELELKKGAAQKRYVKAHRFGLAPLQPDIDEKGIDEAVVEADYGIAETGTLVIDSTQEDLRLATMISEIHVALLTVESIVDSAADIERQLQSMMQAEGNYTAMITGPSRTADIERVLALGVHGPLQLYVLLIGNDHAGSH